MLRICSLSVVVFLSLSYSSKMKWRVHDSLKHRNSKGCRRQFSLVQPYRGISRGTLESKARHVKGKKDIQCAEEMGTFAKSMFCPTVPFVTSMHWHSFVTYQIPFPKIKKIDPIENPGVLHRALTSVRPSVHPFVRPVRPSVSIPSGGLDVRHLMG